MSATITHRLFALLNVLYALHNKVVEKTTTTNHMVKQKNTVKTQKKVTHIRKKYKRKKTKQFN